MGKHMSDIQAEILNGHLCPVWVGYLLANPLRKLFHNPNKIIGPHIKTGMTVLDVGSAMGFFSIPAAKMVGLSGRVVCVDCQAEMLAALEKRAKKAGVSSQIEPRVCQRTALGLEDLSGQVDVAFAFAMVHEAPDPSRLLREIAATLKPGGTLLVAEPTAHVSRAQIEETLAVTKSLGLKVVDEPKVRQSVSFVLKRAA